MTKFAYEDPKYRRMAVIPSGVRVTREEARRQGFTIATARKPGQFPDAAEADRVLYAATVSPQRQYQAAVLALPEAQSRPCAAAIIGATFDAQSMPPERANAYLRGLPTEEAAAPQRANMSDTDLAMFRRRAEIRIAALTFRADRYGDESARTQAKKLSTAMRMWDGGGVSLANAFNCVGLDARATTAAILGVKG